MSETSTISSALNPLPLQAGIAGLAAARALRDHNVTILEQSRMKEEVGAAIHMGPNASRIALEWGLDVKRVQSCKVNYVSFAALGSKITKADDSVLQYHELTSRGDTIFKIPMLGLPAPWLLQHRVDLHNELRRLATTEDIPGTPANIRTAAKVVEVVGPFACAESLRWRRSLSQADSLLFQDTEAGTVKLADGETLRADVIIAADGIHSIARTAVLGEQSFAQPSGHSAYRALVSSPHFISVRSFAVLTNLLDHRSPVKSLPRSLTFFTTSTATRLVLVSALSWVR